MKVWVKRPKQAPALIDVENELHSLQKIVDGYIEVYPLSPNVVIICNEEGRIRELPFNTWMEGATFYGTIIIAGADGEEFCDCGIDEDDLREYYPYLWEE